jgi:Tol biopolymer transport system component
MEAVHGDRPFLAASPSGPLVYREGSARFSQLAWFQPGDGLRPVFEAGSGFYSEVALSPAGSSAAVINSGDLWTVDLERGVTQRLTTSPASDDANPVWSPDGARIAFRSRRYGIQEVGSDGSTEPRDVPGGRRDSELVVPMPSGWSRDGRFLFLTNVSGASPDGAGVSRDLWALSLRDGRRTRLLASRFSEFGAVLSPDGRWLAYLSNDSGREEAYVRAFRGGDAAEPSVGARWAVSTGGAESVKWQADGKALFYVSPGASRKVMVAEVLDTSAFRTGQPRLKWELPAGTVGVDIAADGSRALLSVSGDPNTAASVLRALVNWQELLRH